MDRLKIDRTQSGFTLVELMIVVAIIGILAAIVVPAYGSYVTRSKRTQCRAALMQVMQQQERYYTQNNTYLGFSAPATAVAASAIPMKSISGDSFANSACLISSVACTGLTLSGCVIATGTPVKADAEVGNITLQSDGAKGCSGTNQTKCWSN